MKKFLIIALALMLALALVACSNEENPDTNPDGGVIDLNPTGTGDSNGTGTPGEDTNPGNIPDTPVEETFTEKEQTIFIVTDVANIRSDTYVSESTFVAYAKKGAEYKSVAYSANWYKIEYETEVEVTTEVEVDGETTTQTTTETQVLTCYLHRTVACVKDTTAVDLDEPITLYIIAYALNVRSYYDFEVDNNLLCQLVQGDEVTAIAKGNGWYKIQLSDDAQGNPVYGYISANENYVSTTKPEDTTVEETTEAEQEEATTEAAE